MRVALGLRTSRRVFTLPAVPGMPDELLSSSGPRGDRTLPEAPAFVLCAPIPGAGRVAVGCWVSIQLPRGHFPLQGHTLGLVPTLGSGHPPTAS